MSSDDQPHTLADILRHQARQRPESIAIKCEDRSMSYRQLDEHSNRLAHAILASGVGQAGRVAYLGKESEHYYALLFACAKSDTVLVPVNWRLSAPEVAHILRDAGAALLFVESEYADMVRQTPLPLRWVPLDNPRGRGAGLLEWMQGHCADPLQPTATRDQAVIQLYTSGTTGLPKGVVLAHRSFFAIQDALLAQGVDWLDWRADDVSLVAIPGFHVAGVWWAVQGLRAGVKNIIMRSFQSQEAVRLIHAEGVSTSLVVPAMMYMMLAEPAPGQQPFASLRKLAYGGSPISESLLRQSMAVFDCAFVQLYGLTESGNAAVCLPAQDHRPGSPLLRAAGRALPGVAIEVRDAEGRALPCGEVGEICLRTPAVMCGYWGLSEATRATLQDGWLRTGDAGHLDAQGYLFVSDRLKDLIIVAGENIYPAEVENALCKHPAVREAAVVGVPDERWGEAVHAYVVLGEPAPTPRQLMVFLKQHLADFKIPTRYHVLDAIPRNPSGKILRRLLRAPTPSDAVCE